MVDCDNFYASCERVFRPDLDNKPIAILSNNDGCIIARSAEVKAMGIQMGEPLFKVKRQLIQTNTAIFSSNYELYGDLSRRVMDTLTQFSPDTDVYSIDEAFLDLSKFHRFDLTAYGREIQRTVYRNIGIPVSVGIASTKTLAKLASRLAKKSAKAKGVLNLVNSPWLDLALERTDLKDIWGIGSRFSSRLRRMDIHTAKDLRDFENENAIRKKFTVTGLRTQYELKGISCIELEPVHSHKQSICNSRTFSRPVYTLSDLKEAVASYASRAAEKLRFEKGRTKIIQVALQRHFSQAYNDWSQATIQLPVASSDTKELIQYALIALERIFVANSSYRKAAVVYLEIRPSCDFNQQDLFDNRDRDKHERLMKVVDKINSQYDGAIQSLACGINNDWTMRRAKLSPKYTTHWNHLRIVN